MDGALEERRGHIRLHYATIIRFLGILIWIVHIATFLVLTSQPHFEIDSNLLTEEEDDNQKLMFQFRSRRVFFSATEHVVIMWNMIYAMQIEGRHNRVWCYVWFHYNWTATPLLSVVIMLLQFSSQDMSFYNLMEDCRPEELITALVYFMLGFNTYLLAYNQLRFLQNQATRPYKPGLVLPARAAELLNRGKSLSDQAASKRTTML